MKNRFFSLLIALIISLNLNASINVANEVVNIDDINQVLNYDLFGQMELELPKYLTNNEFSAHLIYFNVANQEVDKNTQDLLFYFLNTIYNHLKAIEAEDDEDWEISAQLDYILSLLNELADNAKESGNVGLYDYIQQRFFPRHQ